jgi:hypothetical protein
VGLTNARLRLATFGLAAAQTLFWFYTFTYIGSHANPKGDGMERLAVIPIGFIFVLLVLPALVLCGFGGRYALASKLAAGFAIAGLIANAVAWTQSWASSRTRRRISAGQA